MEEGQAREKDEDRIEKGSIMLDDKDVLKVCYYWAKRLKQPGIEFDELVSVGYLHGKPLNNVKLLQQWVMYKMRKFIADELKHRSEAMEDEAMDAAGAMCIDDGTYVMEVVTGELANDLDALIKEAGIEELGDKQSPLYKHGKSILIMRYWDSMKLKEIAEHFGVAHQSITVRLHLILERLRNVYERRMR